MTVSVEPVTHSAMNSVSDAELLLSCQSPQRTAAIEELVRRHGRTVLAVCRGILNDGPDAEDAFQATFIVLLRRAGEIRQPAAIGGWLCGVATRIARRLRQRRTRNAVRVATLATPREPVMPESMDPLGTAIGHETRAVVWTALGELPQKYRDPLVMCDLQDHTTEQAAVALKCPVGTLRSRLLKARELLHRRLLRHGLTLTAAAILAVFVESRAQAAVPPALLRKTVQAITTGGSSRPVQLAGSVNFSRLPLRWLVAVLALGLVGLLTWLAIPKAPPAPPDSPPAPIVRVEADSSGTLLVVSQRNATVTLLDARSGQLLTTIPTDPCPHEVAVSPDGRTAAISNYGLPFGLALGDSITLVDVTTGTRLPGISLPKGSAPHGLCWLDSQRLLCTTEAQNAVVEIDVPRRIVVRTLRTAQPGSHMIGANAKLAWAYTTNILAANVTVFDLQNGTKVRDIPVGAGAEGLALSPDGRHLWVANRADNTLSVIDTTTLAVDKTLPAAGMPIRLAFTPDGSTVLMSAIESNELCLWDAKTFVETKRLPLESPVGMTFSPDGRTAYCTLFQAESVAIVDVPTGTVTNTFVVPGDAVDGIAYSPIRMKTK